MCGSLLGRYQELTSLARLIRILKPLSHVPRNYDTAGPTPHTADVQASSATAPVASADRLGTRPLLYSEPVMVTDAGTDNGHGDEESIFCSLLLRGLGAYAFQCG